MRFFEEIPQRGRVERLLTNDFCPWANRYLNWLRRPLPLILLTCLAALLGGLGIGPQGYVVASILMSVTLLGMTWPWLGLRGIRAQGQFNRQRVTEGEAVLLSIEIQNRWPWPVWGLVLENVFSQEPASGPAAGGALAAIGGWTTARFDFTLVPSVRGVFPASVPRLATGFPFGVWTSRRDVKIENRLLVWPRRFELATRPLPAGKWFTYMSPSDHRQGDQGECCSVRPYRRGDLLRNIHWSHTARLNRFVVKERQGNASGSALVQVCIDQTLLDDLSPQGAWEWSLRTAVSVCQRLLEDHAVVNLIIGARRWNLSSNTLSQRQLLDELARIQPGAVADIQVPANLRNLLWICICGPGGDRQFAAIEQAQVKLVVDPRHWTAEDRTCAAQLQRFPAALRLQWERAASNAWRGTEQMA